MLVDYSRVRGPRAVKYIWSERVPVGTHLTSNMGLTQVLVLRSGAPADANGSRSASTCAKTSRSTRGTRRRSPPAFAVLTDSYDTIPRAKGLRELQGCCQGRSAGMAVTMGPASRAGAVVDSVNCANVRSRTQLRRRISGVHDCAGGSGRADAGVARPGGSRAAALCGGYDLQCAAPQRRAAE